MLGDQLNAYKSTLEKWKHKYVGPVAGIRPSKRIQLKADSLDNDEIRLPKRTKTFKYADIQDSRIDKMITYITKLDNVNRLMSYYICSKTFYTDKHEKSN